MLNSKQRQFLKGLAHASNPVIQIGNAGMSPTLLDELDRALAHHELLKVRLPALERDVRAQMAAELSKEVNAELVQTVGRVALLYRPGQKKKIQLP